MSKTSPIQFRCLATAALACAALAGWPARAAPSTTLEITGAVAVPRTYDYASLSALPATTQTDSFLAGNTPQTHTYTGTSLWGLLNRSAPVVDPNIKNDVLNQYVVATASDGYKVVYSLGELNPNFGNRPNLVAYTETINNVSAPLGGDGFARTTAAGDVKGGRYVSNLVDLDVRHGSSTLVGTGGGLSSSFAVSGAVLAPMTFNLAALQSLPTLVETVGGHVYTGVSFWSLLNATVGLVLDPAAKNDVLGKYVVATGTDG